MTFCEQCNHASGPRPDPHNILGKQRPRLNKRPNSPREKLPLSDGFEASVILGRCRSLKLKLEDANTFDALKTQTRQNIYMSLHREATGLILKLRLIRLDEISIYQHSAWWQHGLAALINGGRVRFATEIMQRPGGNDCARRLNPLFPRVHNQIRRSKGHSL